jgi:hypothetical protein
MTWVTLTLVFVWYFMTDSILAEKVHQLDNTSDRCPET